MLTTSLLHPLLEGSLEIKSMKLGLERMQAFDAALGAPSTRFASIQVGGTNGKGSVTLKIAAALQAQGKKVGLYTSPHIHSYCERIQINGLPISQERAGVLFEKILSTSSEQPSYFELLTLCAFLYFAEENVDVAVLEVGMGGRLDATNIVTPLVSVITSIDFDHKQYLGDTLEKIAFEKAGIIKPNIPVVIGPQAKPLSVFQQVAFQKKSPLRVVSGNYSHYEEENQAIARQVLEVLKITIDEEAIQKVPPLRFEWIRSDLVLDVGHNPAALERTFDRIGNKKIRVLAAFSADKEIDPMLDLLQKRACAVHLSEAPHERALPASRFNPRFSCWVDANLERAFETAYRLAQEQGQILLVCGTFFMMDTIRNILKLNNFHVSAS